MPQHHKATSNVVTKMTELNFYPCIANIRVFHTGVIFFKLIIMPYNGRDFRGIPPYIHFVDWRGKY